jgi:hypothetical protein
MTHPKIFGLLLAAFAVLPAGCGGMPGDDQLASPDDETVPTVAPLYIKNIDNHVVRAVDPGFLQHLLGQLQDEGNGDQAERLARTYDVATGKLHSVFADIAATVQDTSFNHILHQMEQCSGPFFWRTCTVPLSSSLGSAQWNGVPNFVIDDIKLFKLSAPPPPPPGGPQPPRILYSLFRRGLGFTGEFDAAVSRGFSNGRAIEAVKVRLEGSPQWRVTYALWAIGSFFPNFADDGAVAGQPGSNVNFDRFYITVFRLDGSGGSIP